MTTEPPSLALLPHARWQAERRGIDEATVLAVARHPDQVTRHEDGRETRHAKIAFPPAGEVYLVRVVVERAADREVVVTVYRTSKIAKYWVPP